MPKVILHNIAEATLRSLFQDDPKTFKKIQSAIDNLSEKGLDSSHIKKLTGTKDIFRKRVGRWRIVFTLKSDTIDIWIVAVEKDSKKDYPRWVQYISYHIEGR